MDQSYSFSFLSESVNDQSLLQEIPATKNKDVKKQSSVREPLPIYDNDDTRDVATSNSNVSPCNKLKLTTKKVSEIEVIDLDEDDEVQVASTSAVKQSSPNTHFPPGDDHSSDIEILDHPTGGFNQEIPNFPSSPKSTSSVELIEDKDDSLQFSSSIVDDTLDRSLPFTKLKSTSSPSRGVFLQDYYDKFSQNNPDFGTYGTRLVKATEKVVEDEWVELDDDQPISMASSTPLVRLKADSTRRRKRVAARSGTKGKLPGTKPVTHQRPPVNLFEDRLIATQSESQNSQNSQESISIPKKDILRHITLSINKPVFDLSPNEIQTLLAENQIDFDVELEQELMCVTWKCRPQLENLLNQIRLSETSQFQCVSVLPDGRFDQLLLVLPCDVLHDHVIQFIENVDAGPQQPTESSPEDDLLQWIQQHCRQYNIFNVTVVIYRMEQYLRTQRSRINNSFRRRMNLLMAENDSTVAVPRRRNNRSGQSALSTPELTLDQVEMCLLDCQMRFFYALHEGDKARSSFNVMHVDSGNELAIALFRFSRSLSEQVYRAEQGTSHSLDFFAQSDKLQAVDPVDEESIKILWFRQLQQFPNSSSENAEAISSAFPTPQRLLSALRSTSNPIQMLANLGRTRRVGTELATKIHLFLTTSDPNLILKGANGTRVNAS